MRILGISMPRRSALIPDVPTFREQGYDVLIDGKRGMPVNPQMFVDTNSIPAAAIQRVEVISGGASATR